MIKGVTHAHLRPIWYHSEPSDVPYSPNQFLCWDFFLRFLQQTDFKDLSVDNSEHLFLFCSEQAETGGRCNDQYSR